MNMRADDRRHHGLARQIHVRRPGWRQLTATADLSDDAAFHDKRSVLQRRRTVPGNQARTLIDHRSTTIGGSSAGAQQRKTGKDNEGESQHGSLTEDSVWQRLYT